MLPAEWTITACQVAALGMSLRKVSYEAFTFSVFSGKNEATEIRKKRSH